MSRPISTAPDVIEQIRTLPPEMSVKDVAEACGVSLYVAQKYRSEEAAAEIAAEPTAPKETPPSPSPNSAKLLAQAVPQRAPVDVLSQNQAVAVRFMEGTEPNPTYLTAETARETADVEKTIAAREREIYVEEARHQRRLRTEMIEAVEEKRPMRPIASMETSTIPDQSIINDDSGNPLGTPGYHKRWVRLRDAEGRPSSQRAGELAHYGYRTITNPDGTPKTGPFGMAMEISPELEAERRAVYGKKLIAVEQYEDDLEETASRGRTAAGRPIGTLIRGETHGTRA